MKAELAVEWEQKEAINLCCLIERFCPVFGFHVALTGGLLYKEGNRKDCDILFYRIREVTEPNIEGLLDKLCDLGFSFYGRYQGFTFVTKGTYAGKNIDILIPENDDGEYP